MISVLFAVLTAISNGTASVLQRRAASKVPDTHALHLSLIGHLLRQRIWLTGIAFVIIAAICQAVALATGPIAVVQPIFVIELPITLLIASYAFHTPLPHTAWYGVAAVTTGLTLGLAAAEPTGGTDTVNGTTWIPALLITAAAETLLITTALHTRNNTRAALLGLAAACAYALTAALLKDAATRIEQGTTTFFATWQLYATAIAGLGALFLLQNALQAGSLIASQPILTLGDALISITYGITLYNETVRTNWWLIPELTALTLITAGCIELARTPLPTTTPPKPHTP